MESYPLAPEDEQDLERHLIPLEALSLIRHLDEALLCLAVIAF